MDITIAQRAMAAYKHVTSTVLNQPDGSPLLKALDNAGVFDILDLISLTRQQVHSLSYDDNGTMRPVAAAPRNKIITFVAYINYQNNHGTPIGNDYFSVTEAQYDNFRGTEYLRPGNSDLLYPDVQLIQTNTPRVLEKPIDRNNHDNNRGMFMGINPNTKKESIMDISDTKPNIIDAQIMAPPNTEHDNNGMEQHCSRDNGKEIIMGNIIDEQGMVRVGHNKLPFEDDIHGERGQGNPDNVRHQIPIDHIREQQTTIKLFPTASPPPKPPPPKPPPHPC